MFFGMTSAWLCVAARTIINMSMTASLIIPVLLFVRLCFRKVPKVFSYALWGIVLFRLLCPVSVSTPVSVFNLTEMPAGGGGLFWQKKEINAPALPDQSAQDALPYGDNVKPYLPAQGQDIHVPGGHEQNTYGSGVSDAVPPALRDTGAADAGEPMTVRVFAVVWIAGIITLAGVNLVSYLSVRRKVACSLKLQDNIYICDWIETPFCLGVIKPRIYLPSALEDKEREYIILHERHHIMRGDHIIKLAAFLALCLHWFNPLVWLSHILAGRDMEMNCDEVVMRKMGFDIRAQYSASLLHLASGKRIFIASPLAFGDGSPKQRIRNVMRYHRPSMLTVSVAVAVCVIVAICLISNAKGQSAADEQKYDPEEAEDQGQGAEDQIQKAEEQGKQAEQDTYVRSQISVFAAHWNELHSPSYEDGFSYEYFMIADLDHDGILELFVSEEVGTGHYTYTNVYQVVNGEIRKLKSSLAQMPNAEFTGDSEPDLVREWMSGYADPATGVVYYLLYDMCKCHATEYYETKSAMYLSKDAAQLRSVFLAQDHFFYNPERHAYMDSQMNEIDGEQYADLEDHYFEEKGCQRFRAHFSWVDRKSANENKNDAQTLEDILWQSYQGFYLFFDQDDAEDFN